MSELVEWLLLPEYLVIEVFSYLDQSDKFRASLVCKDWNNYFHSPQLWRSFQFSFCSLEDLVQLKCLENFASYMRSVSIRVNQGEEDCRIAACQVVEFFSTISSRRLERLSIRFLGNNPLLYSGQEFVEALSKLFSSPSSLDGNQCVTFKEIDLSGLKINLDASLILQLSINHHRTLQKLNLQNGVLVGNSHPSITRQLVTKCLQLTHLHLHGSTIDDGVILALTEPQTRQKLQVLSIICRRDQKYLKEISSEAWTALVKFSPALKVTLCFDHTCPLEILPKVMKPEVPIDVLFLETATDLADEIRLAVSYYHHTLTKLAVICPPQMDTSLDLALIYAVQSCKLLNSLHVFCVIKKETIEEILTLNEYLRINKTYTLKDIPEPGPWMPGKGYY